MSNHGEQLASSFAAKEILTPGRNALQRGELRNGHNSEPYKTSELNDSDEIDCGFRGFVGGKGGILLVDGCFCVSVRLVPKVLIALVPSGHDTLWYAGINVCILFCLVSFQVSTLRSSFL